MTLSPDKSEEEKSQIKGVEALEIGDKQRLYERTQLGESRAANKVCRAGERVGGGGDAGEAEKGVEEDVEA